MIIMGMRSELEKFFSYFSLTSKQKCRYAQIKLVGKTYWRGKDNHIDCRCWFVLKDLRTLYALHLLCSSEADYKEPNVEHEPEL